MREGMGTNLAKTPGLVVLCPFCSDLTSEHDPDLVRLSLSTLQTLRILGAPNRILSVYSHPFLVPKVPKVAMKVIQ
jgi:hypothetical protein